MEFAGDGETINMVKPDKEEKQGRYDEKKHIFIIGSKGIPANYGGFETFVEKLTAYKQSDNIFYHVACLSDKYNVFEYNHAECFEIKVPSIGAAKAVYYDVAAVKYCIEYCREREYIKNPIFYILACRIGPFIGHYKKQIREIGGVLCVNPDGHEWKRKKWPLPIRKYWKFSEKYMIKHADEVICDSKNIEKYICNCYEKYRPKTTFIAYGADIQRSVLDDSSEKIIQWYREKGVVRGEFYLIVGRFVPENNYELVIREFMKSNTKKSLAIITTSNEGFMRKLKKSIGFDKDSRIKFVGTVYDAELLKKIREDAFGYIHGHEVGGTNPSLLEALASTSLNLLLNVGFNKEVAENGAKYWSKQEGNLSSLIDECEKINAEEMKVIGKRALGQIEKHYTWEHIVEKYESLWKGL